MQDPVREMPGLINALLQAPAERQRELIERYYAPECKLTHDPGDRGGRGQL